MLPRGFRILCAGLLVLAGAPLSRAPASELETELITSLGEARSPRQARQLVQALAELATPAAFEALAEHLSARGPAQAEALEALWLEGTPLGHEAIFARASRASPEDPLSIEAIRACALIPGTRVARLLERLRADWSEEVQDAAARAQALRERGGLEVETPIKEVPLDAVYQAAPTQGVGPEGREPDDGRSAQSSQAVRRRRRTQRLEQSRFQEQISLLSVGAEEGRGGGSQPRPRSLAFEAEEGGEAWSPPISADSQEDPPESP